jgi:hypothetical protein
MAQTQRTHDSISYNGNTTTISNLRTAFTSGNVVTAADVNSLIGLINAWDNHTHTYTDAYQLATFGDNGDRANYTESKTTAAHDQAQANIANVSTGNIITAAKHNEMANNCTNLTSHSHIINDRTAI